MIKWSLSCDELKFVKNWEKSEKQSSNEYYINSDDNNLYFLSSQLGTQKLLPKKYGND